MIEIEKTGSVKNLHRELIAQGKLSVFLDTPKELAEFLEKKSENAVWINEECESYPLTKTQLGIYLEAQMNQSGETYTIPYCVDSG